MKSILRMPAVLAVAISLLAVADARAQTAYDATKFVKPSDAELQRKLTDIQYSVTQHDDTETPFSNKYWDNHAPVEKLVSEEYGKYLPLFHKEKK